MGEFKRSVKGSYDSMRRKMGLKKDFSAAHREKVARRRRFSPLGLSDIEEIESDLGAELLDDRKRRRRRRAIQVADTLLGGSAAERLGG